jgi:hypothetical protein
MTGDTIILRFYCIFGPLSFLIAQFWHYNLKCAILASQFYPLLYLVTSDWWTYEFSRLQEVVENIFLSIFFIKDSFDFYKINLLIFIMVNYNHSCVKNIATSALFDKNKSKLKWGKKINVRELKLHNWN